MTSLKSLVCLLVILFFASLAVAAGDGSDPSGTVQNQTADPALFGLNAENQPGSSDLFFLKTRPRLDLSTPAGRSRSAVLNGADCYTMRMYKVKRKEHFAGGESGTRGYSTCEMASNYQLRSAMAHVQTAEGHESRGDAPQK